MMERLRVAENGRYLETTSGKAFFYLADTAWTIGNKLSMEEVDFYLTDRKGKGFTAIQIVLLNPETEKQISLPGGELAIVDNNPLKINLKYLEYMDNIIKRAEQIGLYITLLPAWGQLVTGDNWLDERFEKLVHEDNAYQFGSTVGGYYRDRTNIIWCLGGDRNPVHRGEDYRMVWRKMAEGIAKSITGKDLKWNEQSPFWQEVLITYHPTISDDPPCFSSSKYYQDEPWLSFHMLQSGHRDFVRNYDQIHEDYNRIPPKPVLDGEPNYEDWVFPTANGSDIHSEWNVRKRAYWSVLAGACGHTYGHACVWRMVKENEKSDTLRMTWKEALSRPGARQMLYLKQLIESVDFHSSHPCQEMLGITDNYLDIRRQCRVADNGSYAFIYFTSGGTETLNLNCLRAGDIQYKWFNPRNGKYSQENQLVSSKARIFSEKIEIISPTKGSGRDWVLVLRVIGLI